MEGEGRLELASGSEAGEPETSGSEREMRGEEGGRDERRERQTRERRGREREMRGRERGEGERGERGREREMREREREGGRVPLMVS